MKKILLKHPKKQSRKVVKTDIKTVLKDCQDLYRICHEATGKYPGALAMAHVQVEENEPLRFFVLNNGDIIINPKIVNKEDPYTHIEWCMSFAYRDKKKVKRFKKVTVECVLSSVDDKEIDLSNISTIEAEGLKAAIYQHEIGHMNLDLVY